MAYEQSATTPPEMAEDGSGSQWPKPLPPLTIDQLNSLLLETCTVASTRPETENLEVVEELLRQGADVNCRDLRTFTALHRCVIDNRLCLAELLLQRGAQPDATIVVNDPVIDELHLETSLSITVKLRYYAMAELLLRYGASLAVPRVPPIAFTAVRYAGLEMMRLLVGAGLDFDGDKQVYANDGFPKWSLLEYAFMHASSLETEMQHVNLVRARHLYSEKMELIQYLLENGCAPPSPHILHEAIRLFSFRTLTRAYMICSKQKISNWVWPSNLPVLVLPSRLHIAATSLYANAQILRDTVSRCRTLSQNADPLLRCLGNFAEDKEKAAVQTLLNLSIRTIRYSIAKRQGNLEAAVDEVTLPRGVKRKLCLTDLSNRLADACDSWRFDYYVIR